MSGDIDAETPTPADGGDAWRPDWSFWIWLAALLGLVGGLAAMLSAWVIEHAFNSDPVVPDRAEHAIISLGGFPDLTSSAVRGLLDRASGDPRPLLMDRRLVERPSWVRHFPAPEDSGYLLFSGVDPTVKHSDVELIRIADGTILARWNPNWRAVNGFITNKKWGWKNTLSELRAFHPIVLDGGDVVFNTYSAMARIDLCTGKPIWVLDWVIHHSNELDPDGSIWTASISEDGLRDNPWLQARIRDDSVARISPAGRVLENRSLVKILRDNGLQALLFGTSGHRIGEDPIHLNQISIASTDSKFWQRGDLLLSARHLSTVFLYRPSTGKILWHRTGPWMNQHDAEFIDDHRISVFSNNVFGGATEQHKFLAPTDINRVFIFDFSTGEATEPYQRLLELAQPVTLTEGRARILPDGGLFVEETSNGRLLRFTRDQLLWSRVNDYDVSHIGLLSWSRYLTADEGAMLLRNLATRHCDAIK